MLTIALTRVFQTLLGPKLGYSEAGSQLPREFRHFGNNAWLNVPHFIVFDEVLDAIPTALLERA